MVDLSWVLWNGLETDERNLEGENPTPSMERDKSQAEVWSSWEVMVGEDNGVPRGQMRGHGIPQRPEESKSATSKLTPQPQRWSESCTLLHIPQHN